VRAQGQTRNRNGACERRKIVARTSDKPPLIQSAMTGDEIAHLIPRVGRDTSRKSLSLDYDRLKRNTRCLRLDWMAEVGAKERMKRITSTQRIASGSISSAAAGSAHRSLAQ